jgi:SAM-dependent methyltransferase
MVRHTHRVARADLRVIFDQDAELYARARPGYPEDLLADLAELAGIGPGAQVVEIGPGTGQATRALARRGAHVLGVELGSRLAAVLRRELAELPVEVVVSAFEDWTPSDRRVDAVVAFTSWHWLDPAVRAGKVASVLRPGGTLATVTTEHVLGGTEQFFARAQDCYERWDPATPPGLRLLPSEEIPEDVDEVDGDPRFGPATRRRYFQDITYSTSEYLDVLRTYSGHRALDEDRRRELLSCIGGLIDRDYAGMITKRYMYELRVTRTVQRS